MQEPIHRPALGHISKSTIERLAMPKKAPEPRVVSKVLPTVPHRSVYVKANEARMQSKHVKQPAWEAAPFVPRKSMKPLTVAEDVPLANRLRKEVDLVDKVCLLSGLLTL